MKWHEKGNTASDVLCPLICIFKSCWSGVWSEPASICACLNVLARRVSRVLWRVRCISKTSLWSSPLVLNPQQREKRTFAAQFHQWPTQCNYNFKTQDSTTKQYEHHFHLFYILMSLFPITTHLICYRQLSLYIYFFNQSLHIFSSSNSRKKSYFKNYTLRFFNLYYVVILWIYYVNIMDNVTKDDSWSTFFTVNMSQWSAYFQSLTPI